MTSQLMSTSARDLDLAAKDGGIRVGGTDGGAGGSVRTGSIYVGAVVGNISSDVICNN